MFRAIEATGDAWSWMVLSEAIVDGVSRFDGFQSRLGIARSTLSARLTHLCANGLVERHGQEYRLTEMGDDFQLASNPHAKVPLPKALWLRGVHYEPKAVKDGYDVTPTRASVARCSWTAVV